MFIKYNYYLNSKFCCDIIDLEDWGQIQRDGSQGLGFRFEFGDLVNWGQIQCKGSQDLGLILLPP